LRDNLLGGASVCVASREALERLGGFDPRLRSSQDWDLWIRLRQQGRIIVCPEPLVNYLEHDGERITNRLDSQLRGALRIYFKYRLEMDEAARRRHLSLLCYVKSRQSKRRSGFRLRYLALCLRTSTWRAALSHGVRSAPGIIRDMLA
jgi:GT2 family glycosyltransferase